jgi:hypothetical protein
MLAFATEKRISDDGAEYKMLEVPTGDAKGISRTQPMAGSSLERGSKVRLRQDFLEPSS